MDEETAPLPEAPAGEQPALGRGPCSPLPELLEDHAVGEALAADSDTLENPVATQLVQHQMWVQLASLEKKIQAPALTSAPRN